MCYDFGILGEVDCISLYRIERFGFFDSVGVAAWFVRFSGDAVEFQKYLIAGTEHGVLRPQNSFF